ncbi:MAG: hypothetical protein DI589_22325 [Shinella sp.]|nr:MAG: hypothetical protein DI589_22325 [Shinella sp.]
MPHALDIVLDEFKSDIGRVENLLNITKLLRDFGASEPPISEGDEPAWREGHCLHAEARNRRTDMPILSGSLLLYLAGRFEYCVKQIVESIADEIVEKTDRFQNLPNLIQKKLKQNTLDIAQNPKKYGHDEVTSEVLLEQLILNIRGDGQRLNVNSAVLSITEANMRPSVLADLLKIVGMGDFWREIGKQANVKIALEKGIDQEAAAEAQSILTTIMEDRNQIAHPTATTNFPDADQVLKLAGFLKVLAANIVDLAKVHLTTYSSSLKPNDAINN